MSPKLQPAGIFLDITSCQCQRTFFIINYLDVVFYVVNSYFENELPALSYVFLSCVTKYHEILNFSVLLYYAPERF